MNNKILASIFMIIGTSVGAGMLALPIATATQNLWLTISMLALCWLMMGSGALAILEVNLSLPDGSNMITMADASLGKTGKWVSWIVYLGLLYCLLCAYIAGTSDIFSGLLSSVHINLSRSINTIIATAILATIVYQGIHSVAKANRWLMIAKLLSYGILIIILCQHITAKHFAAGNFKPHLNTLMVMITAYGFAIIVPSLRTYLNANRKLLIKVLLIGSLMPFILYLIWVIVIQGVVSRYGDTGLLNMAANSSSTNSLLIQSLVNISQNNYSATLIKTFIAICALTSFLGVALSLTDCLADSLRLKKTGKQGFLVSALTFFPPLLIVLIKPGIFLLGLSHAGLFCVWLLIALPMIMVYRCRQTQLNRNRPLLPGGTLWLLVCLFFSIAVTVGYFIT